MTGALDLYIQAHDWSTDPSPSWKQCRKWPCIMATQTRIHARAHTRPHARTETHTYSVTHKCFFFFKVKHRQYWCNEDWTMPLHNFWHKMPFRLEVVSSHTHTHTHTHHSNNPESVGFKLSFLAVFTASERVESSPSGFLLSRPAVVTVWLGLAERVASLELANPLVHLTAS